MCVQQVWYVGHVYSNLVLKCIFFSTPDRHLWRPDQGTETCLAWLSSLVQQEASSQTWQTEAQFVGNTWKWRECSDQSSQGPWALHEGPGCEGWTPLRPNHSESSSCHYCKDGKGRDTRGGLGNSPGSDLGRLESQCRGEGWEDLSSHSHWVIGGQVKDKECRWGTQERISLQTLCLHCYFWLVCYPMLCFWPMNLKPSGIWPLLSWGAPETG